MDRRRFPRNEEPDRVAEGALRPGTSGKRKGRLRGAWRGSGGLTSLVARELYPSDGYCIEQRMAVISVI